MMESTVKRRHVVELEDTPMPVDGGTDRRMISKTKSFQSMTSDLLTRPWLGWAFVYSFMLVVFFFYRQLSMKAVLAMYATDKEATSKVYLKALMLAFAEDVVCTTYLVSALWVFDAFKVRASKRFGVWKGDRAGGMSVRNVATFTVSWLLYIATMFPFCADLLLVRMRGMRFTFALIAMAISEKDNLSAVPISTDEVNEGFVHIAVLVVTTTFFASMRTWAPQMDLTFWNPVDIVYCRSQSNGTTSVDGKLEVNTDVAALSSRNLMSESKVLQDDADVQYSVVPIIEPNDDMETERTPMLGQVNVEVDGVSSTSQCRKLNSHLKLGITAIIGLAVVPAIVVAISCATSPLIAYSALNTSLNELFGGVLQPTLPNMDVTLPWPEKIIHTATEDYKLLGSNSLYRQTTGFHGDLAFNVSVAPNDPPNVLLIVVESFRFHDSHYLVGEDDPSNLFKGTNLTITPNFDRWAKRGVALRNLWSSWLTSRSLESLLFAQLPLDSATKTGTTGGRIHTKLSGLPQLFTAKGYETFFTTGCKTSYDQWSTFLPTHGFDTVWGRNKMLELVESDLGIKRNEWKGPEHRLLNWGLHDDLSFQLLGDLMVNKTKAQNRRVVNKKPKKPLFLTHYTISSHTDYTQRPKWYDEAVKPNFSALYEGHPHAKNIQAYLEIRYFSDMELGKFMDRMAAEGILNDTIVVIVGDHGQAPEIGNKTPEDRDVSVTRVAGAIIAEGRLGDAAALVIDDATEQYDLLNTLADITGVPDGGYIQDGVGRSLKRKVKFGERIVYSNNPLRKMSVVRGHQRLRYDRVTDSVLLHDVNKDHDMTADFFPELVAKKQAEWLRIRDDARQVNAYYTRRWIKNCLLAANCTT